MDFKKIENIFLIAFTLLNIYLLVGYINRSETQYASTTSDQVNYIRQMQEAGIDLPDFPEARDEVTYVQANTNILLEENVDTLENQVGSIGPDGTLYTSILADTIELEGDPESGFTDADFTKLNEFINSSAVLFGDQYEFLRFDLTNNVFIYSQSVDGVLVADGTSEISLIYGSNGGIISYQQTYAGPMEERGAAQEIISAQRAVEILFRNREISSNAEVKTPILTYQRTLNLEELSIYGPVWLVPVIESGTEEVLRVDATNESGIILQAPADPTEPTEEEPTDQSDTEETEETESTTEEEPAAE